MRKEEKVQGLGGWQDKDCEVKHDCRVALRMPFRKVVMN